MELKSLKEEKRQHQIEAWDPESGLLVMGEDALKVLSLNLSVRY